jgi:hypothetical protein
VHDDAHREYEIGISGQAGNIAGVIDKRGNISEGARAREYPMPALTGTEFTEPQHSRCSDPWCGQTRPCYRSPGARP